MSAWLHLQTDILEDFVEVARLPWICRYRRIDWAWKKEGSIAVKRWMQWAYAPLTDEPRRVDAQVRKKRRSYPIAPAAVRLEPCPHCGEPLEWREGMRFPVTAGHRCMSRET